MALVYSDTKQNRGVIHLSVGGGASTPLPAYTNEKGLQSPHFLKKFDQSFSPMGLR